MPATLVLVLQEKDRYRMNLLDTFPLLRRAIESGAWPHGLNRHVTPYAFPILLALLFLGPQVPPVY